MTHQKVPEVHPQQLRKIFRSRNEFGFGVTISGSLFLGELTRASIGQPSFGPPGKGPNFFSGCTGQPSLKFSDRKLFLFSF
jgi:hypothetical protein